jgi:hypothetical protein
MPGLRGLPPSRDDPSARLLITDDRACDALTSMLPRVDSGLITVFAAAARCTELLAGRLSWPPATATAMAWRDLSSIPNVRLPQTLTLRSVRRIAGDALRA